MSTLCLFPTAENASTAQTADTAHSANGLSAPEPWHEIGKPGEPQFLNGCKDSGGGVVPVRFYKDHEGVVHLEGAYEGCSEAGEIAFELPPGYRPGTIQEFPVPFVTEAVGAIILPTSGSGIDGSVRCGATHCALNGITFRAES